jgi:hypothetical protein
MGNEKIIHDDLQKILVAPGVANAGGGGGGSATNTRALEADAVANVMTSPSLANNGYAQGDIANANERPFGDFYLTSDDAVAPTTGDYVAELWLLPGDGDSPEKFPYGGSQDPQAEFLVGSFESGGTASEVMSLRNIVMGPNTSRIVVKNTSGAAWQEDWFLDVVLHTLKNVI